MSEKIELNQIYGASSDFDDFDDLDFDTEDQIKIAVIGVGGGGGNMIKMLKGSGSTNHHIELIAANTDRRHLRTVGANSIVLGQKMLGGLGAGLDPEKGRLAAEEKFTHISNLILKKQYNMVFVAAGLGGGTGTGASPVIARAAREAGALTIGVFTKPFTFEGQFKMTVADNALRDLRNYFDNIIVIPNAKIESIAGKNTTVEKSFSMCDEILARAVLGVANLALVDGEVNVDFADIKTVMSFTGLAFMGTGEGKGENSVADAVRNAIESPLLDNLSINGAKGLLTSYEIHPNFPIQAITAIQGDLEQKVASDALVKFGWVKNYDMAEDEVRVTIVATGFEKEVINSASSAPKGGFFSQKTEIHKKMANANYDDDFSDMESPAYLRNQKD